MSSLALFPSLLRSTSIQQITKNATFTSCSQQISCPELRLASLNRISIEKYFVSRWAYTQGILDAKKENPSNEHVVP